MFAIELMNVHYFNRKKVLAIFDEKIEIRERCIEVHCVDPVSYTHLTLPTILRV